jgi:hypothetical protein
MILESGGISEKDQLLVLETQRLNWRVVNMGSLNELTSQLARLTTVAIIVSLTSLFALSIAFLNRTTHSFDSLIAANDLALFFRTRCAIAFSSEGLTYHVLSPEALLRATSAVKRML